MLMAAFDRLQLTTPLLQQCSDLTSSKGQTVSSRIPSPVFEDEVQLIFLDASLLNPISSMGGDVHLVLFRLTA